MILISLECRTKRIRPGRYRLLKTKFRYWVDLQPIFNVFVTVTTLLIYLVKNNFTIECPNVTSLKDLGKKTGQVEALESKIEVLGTFCLFNK